ESLSQFGIREHPVYSVSKFSLVVPFHQDARYPIINRLEEGIYSSCNDCVTHCHRSRQDTASAEVLDVWKSDNVGRGEIYWSKIVGNIFRYYYDIVVSDVMFTMCSQSRNTLS